LTLVCSPLGTPHDVIWCTQFSHPLSSTLAEFRCQGKLTSRDDLLTLVVWPARTS
jgi:hypothetical protein